MYSTDVEYWEGRLNKMTGERLPLQLKAVYASFSFLPYRIKGRSSTTVHYNRQVFSIFSFSSFMLIDQKRSLKDTYRKALIFHVVLRTQNVHICAFENFLCSFWDIFFLKHDFHYVNPWFKKTSFHKQFLTFLSPPQCISLPPLTKTKQKLVLPCSWSMKTT